jgi:hypothetical protein
MNELEVTWTRALCVWWLIVWRSVLGGMLIGGGIGFLIGIIGAFAGVDRETIVQVASILGTALGVVWNLLVTRMALRKKYRGFRIALLPREDAQTSV